MIKLVECPRDAMQGMEPFIPTDQKINYIQSLLSVGFDVLDFGSFVSPKAVPQMADTNEIVDKLDISATKTRLLAIVANVRGAEDASAFDQISYLGYPFSISETFQLRNTNSTIEDSLHTVASIRSICEKANKELVIYISMGFGNPYDDPWNVDIVGKYVDQLSKLGISIISFADTVGVASPDDISYIFKHVVPGYSNIEFGAHLHSSPDNWESKLGAAYENGCRRIDSAIGGYGGCPMAQDDLVGNMSTENVVAYLTSKEETLKLDLNQLKNSRLMASNIF